MNAINYLCLTTVKNHIKDLRHKPSKLILYILCTALIGFMIWSGTQTSFETTKGRPVEELGAIILGFLGFIFITIIFSGLDAGSSFFGMNDVNLLFVSPISSKLILFYGVIRQATLSIIASIFILFQYAFLKGTYGVTFIELMAIFAGYLFLLVCSQFISMLIYMFTNSDINRKRNFKIGLYILLGVIALIAIFRLARGESASTVFVDIGNSTALEYVPFLGWIKAVLYNLIIGNTLRASLFSCITLAGFIGMIFIIFKYNVDYFEDVLQITERTAALRTAAKEGKIADNSSITSKKLKSFGFAKGHGASTIFYKHKLESKRSGFGPFNNGTLMSLVFAIIMSLVFAKELPKPYQPIALLGMLTYLQMFTIASDRWVKELTFPFIYLIPASPFKKLLYCLSYDLGRAFWEAILLFIVIGVLTHASPITIVFCILARISFELLFMSGNVLSSRIFGTILSKGLLFFLYFLLMILLAAPGIIGSMLTMTTICGSLSLPIGFSLSVCILWNIITSSVILLCCKNILSEVEFNA